MQKYTRLALFLVQFVLIDPVLIGLVLSEQLLLSDHRGTFRLAIENWAELDGPIILPNP